MAEAAVGKPVVCFLHGVEERELLLAVTLLDGFCDEVILQVRHDEFGNDERHEEHDAHRPWERLQGIVDAAARDDEKREECD